MKKYETPSLEVTVITVDEVMTASTIPDIDVDIDVK